jgi:hypothetical protein
MSDGPRREAGDRELAAEDGAQAITSAENEPTGIADARQHFDQTGRSQPPLPRRRHGLPRPRPQRHNLSRNYPEPSHESQNFQIPLAYPVCPPPSWHIPTRRSPSPIRPACSHFASSPARSRSRPHDLTSWGCVVGCGMRAQSLLGSEVAAGASPGPLPAA